MVKDHISCRLCGGALADALRLAPTPPANAFVSSPREEQASIPLDVAACRECGHAQLRQVVDPEVLFKNYVYVSGTAPSFIQHFEEYASSAVAKANLSNRDSVLEIGSNDGTFLRAFKSKGLRVLGIEPATRIANTAIGSGIPTLNTFFDMGLARNLFEGNGAYKLITANNVFAHIDNLHEVVEGVKMLLAGDGTFVFEVQYLGDLLDKSLFDVVYHEHLSFHAIAPLVSFFQSHQMEVFDVEKVPTHGGSIRVWAKKERGPQPIEGAKLAYFVNKEREEGISGKNVIARWQRLGGQIADTGAELWRLLDNLADREIVGYGAPAKATTFCYQYGIDKSILSYIVDDSPLKYGLYTPGIHIPVHIPDRLYDEFDGWPDYVLILAWNFADQIKARHQQLTDGGVHWITPFPKLEVA